MGRYPVPTPMCEMVKLSTRMPRHRDEESGQFTDAYSDDEFFDVVNESDGPTGTGEIAERVGCTRRHALNRLRALEDKGVVTSKNVGNTLVWMVVNGAEADA